MMVILRESPELISAWETGRRISAFRVICDFPLKTLVTFTKGRFSEQQLTELLEKLNGVSHE